MEAMSTRTPMTVEEFLAQPESERGIHELIDGEVVVTDPSTAHQLVVGELHGELRTWCRSDAGSGRVIGAIDTAVGPRTILVPDLQWFADASVLEPRLERPKPLGQVVVEVRSPSTWSRDVGVKRAAYEREGVAELWLIDPISQTVLVYRRSTRSSPTFDIGLDLVSPGEELTSPLLPGFAMRLEALFAWGRHSDVVHSPPASPTASAAPGPSASSGG